MRKTGSCLPQVAAKKTKEGFVLPSTRPMTSKSMIHSVFGGIWITVLAIVGISQLRLVGYFIALPIMILLIFVTARFVKRRQTYGQATLHLSRWPVRLNEPFVIGYRVLLKKRVDIVIRGAVVCSEQIGGGDSSAENEFFTDPLTVFSLVDQVSEVESKWEVRLPKNKPPSFETEGAKIAWSIHISLESSQSTISDEFKLLVVPEVVP